AGLREVQDDERSQVGAVERALGTGDQGVNPANDGQPIRAPLPPLTAERRREYVKLVRQKAEEARVAIRNVRRDELHRMEHMQKQGEVAEDESKRASGRLQKITEASVDKVDALANRKEHEVMEI